MAGYIHDKQTFHYKKTLQRGRQFIFSGFCSPFLANLALQYQVHSQSAKTNSELHARSPTNSSSINSPHNLLRIMPHFSLHQSPITTVPQNQFTGTKIRMKAGCMKKNPRNLIAFESPKILSKGRNI